MLENFIEIQLPSSTYCTSNDLQEINAIFFCSKTIWKNSQYFMQPQSYSLFLGYYFLFFSHADTEIHTSEVSQVKQIMGLCWGWQELLDCCFVDFEGGVKYFGFSFQNVCAEASNGKMPS